MRSCITGAFILLLIAPTEADGEGETMNELHRAMRRKEGISKARSYNEWLARKQKRLRGR